MCADGGMSMTQADHGNGGGIEGFQMQDDGRVALRWQPCSRWVLAYGRLVTSDGVSSGTDV